MTQHAHLHFLPRVCLLCLFVFKSSYYLLHIIITLVWGFILFQHFFSELVVYPKPFWWRLLLLLLFLFTSSLSSIYKPPRPSHKFCAAYTLHSDLLPKRGSSRPRCSTHTRWLRIKHQKMKGLPTYMQSHTPITPLLWAKTHTHVSWQDFDGHSHTHTHTQCIYTFYC